MKSIIDEFKVAFFIIPLLIIILLRLYGFDGLFGQDPFEYARFTNQMKRFFTDGSHPGEFLWPRGYPLVASILSFVFSSSLSLQLVSLLSLYGIFYFSHQLIKLYTVKSNFSYWFLLLSLLLSPYVLRNSLVGLSDMLATFCFVSSAFYAAKYLKSRNLKPIIWCFFLGTFAVFTRYAAAIPVLIVFLVISIEWLKKPFWNHLLALLLPLLLVGFHFYLELNNSAFSEHDWLINWDLSNTFRKEFSIAGGNLSYTFLNFFYGLFPLFYPGFFTLNLILLILLFFTKVTYHGKPLSLLLLPLLAYFIFLVGIPFQNNRFLLITYPLLLVLLYPAFHQVTEKLGVHRNWVYSILVVIQLGLFARSIQPTILRNQIEKQIALGLKPYENETLYTFDIDVAMKGRGLNFNYKNLWTEKYESYDDGALALFSEEKLGTAWAEKRPMNNWNNLKDNYILKPLETFDNGWKLYRIEKR